jgi:hypothetical protein
MPFTLVELGLLSSIIISIRQLLHDFPNFKVKFIRRQANLVAHILVRAANSWTSLRTFEISPPCIELIFIYDMCCV